MVLGSRGGGGTTGGGNGTYAVKGQNQGHIFQHKNFRRTQRRYRRKKSPRAWGEPHIKIHAGVGNRPTGCYSGHSGGVPLPAKSNRVLRAWYGDSEKKTNQATRHEGVGPWYAGRNEKKKRRKHLYEEGGWIPAGPRGVKVAG